MSTFVLFKFKLSTVNLCLYDLCSFEIVKILVSLLRKSSFLYPRDMKASFTHFSSRLQVSVMKVPATASFFFSDHMKEMLFTPQGVDLVTLQTVISGVGYFLTTQKITLSLVENPLKILSEKQNPKKFPPNKLYSFSKRQA